MQICVSVSPLRPDADYTHTHTHTHTHTETSSAASPKHSLFFCGICIPKAGHYSSVRTGDGNQNCSGHEGDNNVMNLSAFMAEMIQVQGAFEQGNVPAEGRRNNN